MEETKEPDTEFYPEKFPVTLAELQKELLVHSKDGRSDVPMRVAITVDNMGAFVRYISHDLTLNPTARQHGTRESEINDAGHFLAQAMTLVALRGIDLEDAMRSALRGLRQHECVARTPADPNKIKGESACTAKGSFRGDVWVCVECSLLSCAFLKVA